MNAFRFSEVSIVPQYAMSALNPTRKIGKMISRSCSTSRGVAYDETLPELRRRLDSSALARTCSSATRSSSRAA